MDPIKILLLGNDRLLEYLKSQGDQFGYDAVTYSALKMPEKYFYQFDYVVSYGYRWLIPCQVTKDMDRRIVNLHIGYLPWNRGASPNLWSFIDNTPKGVTIHYVDSGLDSGDIIAQRARVFPPTMTLRETYDALCDDVEHLFKELWPLIKGRQTPAIRQQWFGTFHKKEQTEKILSRLPNGWDTQVRQIK